MPALSILLVRLLFLWLKIAKTECAQGMAGFYRGLPVNAIKCIPEAGIQFATYDLLKARFL
jgi:hypothetical protein